MAHTIYITLLEGTSVLVPVKARKINQNIYEILENDSFDSNDATSIWEFFPGDLVECRKDKDVDSNEELTVASKLIESRFPNRNLHSLVFQIVKSLGKLEQEYLLHFKDEIKILCTDSPITQSNHPIVKKWVENICK